MWDLFNDHAPGVLTWIQAWYATQAAGDWEHGYGISIHSLDNPGWSVRIDIHGTALARRPMDAQSVHRSEHDWYVITLKDGFDGACGL